MAQSVPFSTRLLQLCAVILIATSFSYADKSLRVTEGVQVTRAHAVYRIIPIAMVAVMSAAAAHRRIGKILRQMLNPPILWWTWFAIVAIIAGFLSDIAPLWSAWKCTELLVAMFWASTVLVKCYHQGSVQPVEKCFEAVVGLSYAISCWALACATMDGINVYISGGERLGLEWPGINSINLSVLAAFSVVGMWIIFRRLSPPIVLALVTPPLLILLMAHSRTGLVGLGLAAGYSIFTQRVSVSYRLAFVAMVIMLGGVFMLSEGMRENFRMSSLTELLKLSGRIESEKGDSAWAECVSKIKERPFIGHGFLNMTRFMYRGKRIVGDNGFLHALVSAGLVGAIPMMIYTVGLFAVWFRMGAAGMLESHSNRLFGFGSSAACIAFLKALTTNSLTSSDFAMVLFLLSAAAVTVIRNPPQPFHEQYETA